MQEDLFFLGVKGLIRNDAGHILLLQVNTKNLTGETVSYRDIPGGRIDKGDNPEQALIREIDEELGVADVIIDYHVGYCLSNIRIPDKIDPTNSYGLILSIYSCTCDVSSITLSDEHVGSQRATPYNASILLAHKYPQDMCDLISSL